MSEVLYTERLMLRPIVDADEQRIVEILGNYEVSKWLSSVPHPFGPQDVKTRDAQGKTRWPDVMAISHNGSFVGAISNSPHIGYWLAPEAQGKGVATEVVAAVCRFAFEDQDRQELVSGHYADNHASRRVLEKCGFVKEREGQQFSLARQEKRAHIWVKLTRDRWRLTS